MHHLSETQIVDAVDGRLDAAAAAHLAACGPCGARVAELHELMRALPAVDVPEPSPLFWDHFPSRVSRAIDAPAAPRRWCSPAGLLWGSAAAAVIVLGLLLMPMRTVPVDDAPVTAALARPSATLLADPFDDDLETDDAWALVRSVAEDLDYDDARQIGVAPRAGSIDRVALELSADERAELARLIEQELRRTGA